MSKRLIKDTLYRRLPTINNKKTLIALFAAGLVIWLVFSLLIFPKKIETLYIEHKLPVDYRWPIAHYLNRWADFSNKLSCVLTILFVVFCLFAPAQFKFPFAKYNTKMNRWLVTGWLVISTISLPHANHLLETFAMSIMLLLLVLFFANLKSFQNLFVSVTTGKRIFMASVVTILLFAQLSQQWRYTYPFVHFTMFTDAQESKEVVYYEYEGHNCKSGSFELNPTQVFPALRQRRMEGTLSAYASAVLETNEKMAQQAAKDNLMLTLGAVGHLYNLKHKNQMVCSISMYQCSFNLDTYKDNSSIKKSLVVQVHISK